MSTDSSAVTLMPTHIRKVSDLTEVKSGSAEGSHQGSSDGGHDGCDDLTARTLAVNGKNEPCFG